ncbi:uncharacterized protein LOC121527473 [Xyrichtys novacula]|uniref:Uncharacterized protein LOC121527473 n=1 Tax=Xyrichtys novacula TaxID=13765 RepID=A0AAV1HBJ7_XYRNO|nr:uncharacterized protein LOC121527473 [Xyrichtys novacula]
MRLQMTSVSSRNRYHVVIHAVFIVLAVITQVMTSVVFNLGKDSWVPNALFKTSHRNVSETFPLEVTMDWWSQLYWNMIDVWSTVWLFYGVVGLLNRDALGPESCNPDIHPPMFYLMWTMINISRMLSMSLWESHAINGTSMVGWIPPVLSFYMLYVSYSNLDKHKAWLSINRPAVISWTRYLIQNGLAAFAWWSLLNYLVGLGIVFKYSAGMPDPLISTAVLTLVSLCTVTWFLLQSCLLKKYLCYTFSVYPMLILGLGAMFTRSYRIHDLGANTVFCGLLMILMTILSITHLISECLRQDNSSTVEPNVTFVETVWQPEGNMKNKLPKC